MTTRSTDEDKAFVLQNAREQDVKFIHLWFTDILGNPKSIAITIDELDGVLEVGAGFDGSSIEGFARVDESDMVAVPDPTTFVVLPWRPRENGVARMFCNIHLPNGEPFEGDPRFVLQRNLRRAADLGYTFYVGPEIEFFYFKNAQLTEVLDEGGYFDLTPMDVASDIRRDTVLTLEQMGIGVESSHHEAAPSQHEIDLRYTDALTMADATMTHRLIVKEIAFKHGCYASFMPKPIQDENGSGMHVHQSLFRGETNAFFEANDPDRLSDVAKHYIAGVLAHARAFTLVTNQWVNSYKRLLPGYEAPVFVTWATRNRSDLVRVPQYKPGRDDAVRIEYRAPDPACNPYLAFAVMLAAGLDGIRRKLPLPPMPERNVFQLPEEERQRLEIATLPRSLYEAIEEAEKSDLLRQALGDHVFESLIRNKRIEWEAFRTHVTDFELKRYLPIL